MGTRNSRRRRPPSGFTYTWTTTSAGISWAAAGAAAAARRAAASARPRRPRATGRVGFMPRNLTGRGQGAPVGCPVLGVRKARQCHALRRCANGVPPLDKENEDEAERDSRKRPGRARRRPRHRVVCDGALRRRGRSGRRHGPRLRGGPALAQAAAQPLDPRIHHRRGRRLEGPRLHHPPRCGHAERAHRDGRGAPIRPPASAASRLPRSWSSIPTATW